MLHDLGWQSLDSRRQDQRLVLFYKLLTDSRRLKRRTSSRQLTPVQGRITASNSNVQKIYNSARDVIINLKSKFNRNFRVEQLQTKYDHYASFKVTVPITFKKDLLNKDNWDDNHVFVKSFVKRPSPRF